MKTKMLTPTLKGLIIFLISFLFFIRCNKEADYKNSNGINLSNAVRSTDQSGAVATDWSNLQLRMILYANPSVSSLVSIRFFSYTSLALYEAVRNGIPNGV